MVVALRALDTDPRKYPGDVAAQLLHGLMAEDEAHRRIDIRCPGGADEIGRHSIPRPILGPGLSEPAREERAIDPPLLAGFEPAEQRRRPRGRELLRSTRPRHQIVDLTRALVGPAVGQEGLDLF